MSLLSWRRPGGGNGKKTLPGRRGCKPALEPLETRSLPSGAALDMTFGTMGEATLDFAGGDDVAGKVLVQADGKILLTGTAFTGSNNDFALARFNPDGSLDTSFGSGGKVTLDFAGGNDIANGAALQADGKIVVAGSTSTANGTDFAMARFNANGTVDTGFGSGGKATIDFAGADDAANAVVLQTDGKVLVAGSAFSAATGNDFALARLNANGTPDTTFGSGGKVTEDFGGSDDVANGLVVQGDFRIVLAGGSGSDFALARFNADGTPDTTFGSSGTVTLSFDSGSAVAADVALQADGRIVVAGSAGLDFAVARFNADGTPDTSFGSEGQATIDFAGGNDTGTSLALRPDGRIEVAGFSGTAFALAQLNPDGSPDTVSSTGSQATTTFPGGDAFARSVALQADGKVLAAGAASNGQNNDFALARFLTFSSRDQLFVAQVYAELLERPVDTAGLAFWTGQLAQGQTRQQVVRAIENTSEYQVRVVRDLYQQLLGRDADPAGLNFWTGFLGQGHTIDEVRAGLASSDEYFRVRGGGTNDGFLDALYHDVLNRAVDAVGRSFWDGQLAGGASRQAVALAILGSDESLMLRVNNFYQRFLQRDADAIGLSFWFNAFRGGMREEDVIAGLVGSDEFFAKL